MLINKSSNVHILEENIGALNLSDLSIIFLIGGKQNFGSSYILHNVYSYVYISTVFSKLC